MACVAIGPRGFGESCTMAAPPPPGTGVDDCGKGLACSAGVCRKVCDEQGGEPMCEAGFACMRDAELFFIGDEYIAGVCVPAN